MDPSCAGIEIFQVQDVGSVPRYFLFLVTDSGARLRKGSVKMLPVIFNHGKK